MKKLEDTLEWFKRDIIEIFGNDLVSVVLYGSAATQDFAPKRSDVNFLVVLTDEGIADVWKAHQSMRKWHRKRIAIPLFMTAAYIDSSFDSFPIEFLNMRLAYHVLFGENPLKDIKIRNQDLRLQCERELKGKLLQLRAGMVLAGGRSSELRDLVSRSLVTFSAIFRALLFLKSKDVPKKRAEVFAAGCDAFGLDAGLFKKLHALRERKIKPNRKKMIPLLKAYTAEIEKLSNTVDQMSVKN
jgi:predicted nucleotidyltransferase